jgi:hypothetical protein
MAGLVGVLDSAPGVPPRFVDAATANLNRLARDFEEIQRLRLRAYQRLSQHLYGAEPIDGDKASLLAADPSVQRRKRLEDIEARELERVLQSHVLWPWLEPLKGLRGARTGRLLAAIANPWRFPGQQCSQGHTFPLDGSSRVTAVHSKTSGRVAPTHGVRAIVRMAPPAPAA